jgi:hypothetical protein
MELPMIYPRFVMVSYIWIWNTDNGVNGIKRNAKGMFLGHSLLQRFYDHLDSETHHLGHSTKLKQSGTVEYFIATFEHLDFRTEGMSDGFFKECFISGLKDEICAHVLMAHPQTWLEATQQAKESQQIFSSHICKPSFLPLPKPTNFSPPATHLKIHKLTRVEMVEHQFKGLCYNCDEKYFPGHKCKEHKIFMAMTEDVF